MRQPILWAFLSVAAGIVAAGQLERGLPWVIGVAATLAALIFAWRARKGLFLLGLALLFCAGGLAATAAAQRLNSSHQGAAHASSCGASRWRVVADTPVERVDSSVGRRATLRTEARLRAELCEGVWLPRTGRVQLRLWSGVSVVRGDYLEVKLRLQPFAPPHNFDEPDWGQRARDKGLSAQAQVLSPHAVTERATDWRRQVDQWHQAAAQRIDGRFGPVTGPLVKALALGSKASISAERREVWGDAGVAHILAISGLHVGLVATVIFLLCKLLLSFIPGAGEQFSTRRYAGWVTMGVVTLFCIWTGAAPSTVRATVMVVAYLLGVALGRPHRALNSLGLAGLLMLVVDPASLYDVGFLLSFAAVAALLLIPGSSSAAESAPPQSQLGFSHRAARWLGIALLTSTVATLATVPVAATVFSRISWVAPLSNLIAVPLGALLATPMALMWLLLSACSTTLSQWVAVPLDATLRLLQWWVESIVQGLPAVIYTPPPPWWLGAAWEAALLSLLLWARRRSRAPLIALGCFCTVIVVGGSLSFGQSVGDGKLRVVQAYVGQGDAAIMHLPDGGTVLVDAGGSYRKGGWDPGRGVLAPYLRRHAIGTIDLAVVTHAHPDHLGGFAYLADNFVINELWWSGYGEEVPAMRTLIEKVEQGGGLVRAAAGLVGTHARGGVEFEVMQASSFTDDPELLTLNNSSLVMQVKHGTRTMLFTGDIEREAETLFGPQLPRSDVLKVPHHGSRTSSTDVLRASVRPVLAVISCGEHNRFGFPHEQTLTAFHEDGVAVLRTDLDGAIALESDGERWSLWTARDLVPELLRLPAREE